MEREVSVSVPFEIAMIPVATSVVERSSEAFGLDRRGQLGLALAAEEILAFAGSSGGGGTMEVVCSDRGVSIRVECRVPREKLPLEAFNMTSRADDPDRMGLVLAARSAHRMEVSLEKGSLAVISFEREREYREISAEPLYPDQDESMDIGIPRPDEWPHLAAQVEERYGCGGDLKKAGLMARSLELGLIGALVARSPRGRLGGLVLWRPMGRVIELRGPFCFSPVGRELVEEALKVLGKSDAMGIVVDRPVSDVPEGYFEPLSSSGGVLFRQLREDNGALIWVPNDLRPFVEDAVDRLELPRDIRSAERREGLDEKSLLAVSTEVDGSAVIEPLLAGNDVDENLLAHLDALIERGVRSVSFHLDLGRPDFAYMAQSALEAGFVPKVLIPWGGRGDLLVMEGLR
jgi:hypothetical protein